MASRPMPLARPRGNACYRGNRRVFVRGFDTEHGGYVAIEDEERFGIDDARITRDAAHDVRRGDTLFLMGQFAGDDETALVGPGRVLAVGPCPSRAHQRVWLLNDGEAIAPTLGAEAFTIARSLLPEAERRLVADLAMTGHQAAEAQARHLMRLFGL